MFSCIKKNSFIGYFIWSGNNEFGLAGLPVSKNNI
jgi:hypothetical protein